MNRGLDAISTGVSGLDELLHGGVVRGRMYLVRGKPGTGKTLLGMEFLSDGLDDGETVLFIHGEESRDDIVANAAALGIDLDDAAFLDLGPESDFFSQDRTYDLVDPQDVESEQFIDDIRDAIEDLDPARVCIDPITQLQYVETSDYQFRKRLISLMRFLKDRGTTVLATRTQYDSAPSDDEIASLSDGIIEFERGGGGRRARVPKHRGVGQQDGTHGMEIREGGIEVYPSLVPPLHGDELGGGLVTSGVPDLDELLGGGIERGTATFVSGPTGIGKSTTGAQFVAQAAADGLAPVAYLFEESLETFTKRSEALGLPITELRERGDLTVEPVEPLTLSAEEFARRVQRQVEEAGSQVVMIDGIDGYKVALQGDEQALAEKLHALVRYLTNMDVTVILLDEIKDITGLPTATGANVSYIADNIVLLSYVEMDGELRRVLGVLKKRVSDFDPTIHEFDITDGGIRIAGPVEGVQGVLEGSPTRIDER
ncbi:circadian clock protein KaiC [Halarchaeum rubridurum]|uniref:non-specific serine/threonine protein kinase n=1 Tax=Halarchaeum rubridurum TaxID=489911 RepID=A0A830FYG8_9EURY|nr:ATPase domain-containing protein [Halarchaeum rubridurum]MBP1954391.1 circadian clock protein KaiC [Halarchaeum rubridurum]GGM60603.1 serine/threonine protein kinase [Halarchaeum rubridurum]